VDAVVSPTSIGLNKHSGSPKLALQPGQFIDALVLQIVDSDTVRLAIGDTVVDLQTQVALLPGSTVRLAVRGTPSDMKLVVLGVSTKGINPDATHKAAPLWSPGGEGVADTAPPAARPAGAPEAAHATGADPTRALNLAVRAAAPRQDGLAPLFADLAATLAALPPPARAAAMQVLAFRIGADTGISPAELRTAVARSGIFLEQRLASVVSDGAPAPTAAGDFKLALVELRQALRAAAQAEPSAPPTAPAHPAPSGQAPPPYRGAPPVAQPAVASELSAAAAPEDIIGVLIERTEGALARQTLLQAASMPEASRSGAADQTGARWQFEIPLVAPGATAIAQFEVERDGSRPAAEELAVRCRAAFALDIEPLGPVHVQVSLTGQRATVRLWAERDAAAAALREDAGELASALRAAALDPADIVVRDGAPPRPASASSSGRFVDRAT
jgi:hypothetical protein